MEHNHCDNRLILEKFNNSTAILQALGDMKRQQIIALLIEHHSLNVSQVTEKMDISRPAISHHLKILLQANIVDCIQSGKERYYCLSHRIHDTLQLLKELIEAVELQGSEESAK